MRMLASALRWGGRRRRQLAGRRANAALEFALVFPLLLTMMFGMVDGCDALIAYERVTSSADEIGLMATAKSVTTGTNVNGQPIIYLQLTDGNAYIAGTGIFGLMPGLINQGSAQPFSVTISEVVFTPTVNGCTSNCTYTANVAWTMPLSAAGSSSKYLGSTVYRGPGGPTVGCGVLTQVPQWSSATLSTIPTQGVQGLTSALVVDVSYTFKPMFTQVFVSQVTFWHTAFFAPRVSPSSGQTQYTTYSGSYATICPGYT